MAKVISSIIMKISNVFEITIFQSIQITVACHQFNVYRYLIMSHMFLLYRENSTHTLHPIWPVLEGVCPKSILALFLFDLINGIAADIPSFIELINILLSIVLQ